MFEDRQIFEDSENIALSYATQILQSVCNGENGNDYDIILPNSESNWSVEANVCADGPVETDPQSEMNTSSDIVGITPSKNDSKDSHIFPLGSPGDSSTVGDSSTNDHGNQEKQESTIGNRESVGFSVSKQVSLASSLHEELKYTPEENVNGIPFNSTEIKSNSTFSVIPNDRDNNPIIPGDKSTKSVAIDRITKSEKVTKSSILKSSRRTKREKDIEKEFLTKQDSVTRQESVGMPFGKSRTEPTKGVTYQGNLGVSGEKPESARRKSMRVSRKSRKTGDAVHAVGVGENGSETLEKTNSLEKTSNENAEKPTTSNIRATTDIIPADKTMETGEEVETGDVRAISTVSKSGTVSRSVLKSSTVLNSTESGSTNLAPATATTFRGHHSVMEYDADSSPTKAVDGGGRFSTGVTYSQSNTMGATHSEVTEEALAKVDFERATKSQMKVDPRATENYYFAAKTQNRSVDNPKSRIEQAIQDYISDDSHHGSNTNPGLDTAALWPTQQTDGSRDPRQTYPRAVPSGTTTQQVIAADMLANVLSPIVPPSGGLSPGGNSVIEDFLGLSEIPKVIDGQQVTGTNGNVTNTDANATNADPNATNSYRGHLPQTTNQVQTTRTDLYRGWPSYSQPGQTPNTNALMSGFEQGIVPSQQTPIGCNQVRVELPNLMQSLNGSFEAVEAGIGMDGQYPNQYNQHFGATDLGWKELENLVEQEVSKFNVNFRIPDSPKLFPRMLQNSMFTKIFNTNKMRLIPVVDDKKRLKDNKKGTGGVHNHKDQGIQNLGNSTRTGRATAMAGNSLYAGNGGGPTQSMALGKQTSVIPQSARGSNDLTSKSQAFKSGPNLARGTYSARGSKNHGCGHSHCPAKPRTTTMLNNVRTKYQRVEDLTDYVRKNIQDAFLPRTFNKNGNSNARGISEFGQTEIILNIDTTCKSEEAEKKAAQKEKDEKEAERRKAATDTNNGPIPGVDPRKNAAVRKTVAGLGGPVPGLVPMDLGSATALGGVGGTGFDSHSIGGIVGSVGIGGGPLGTFGSSTHGISKPEPGRKSMVPGRKSMIPGLDAAGSGDYDSRKWKLPTRKTITNLETRPEFEDIQKAFFEIVEGKMIEERYREELYRIERENQQKAEDRAQRDTQQREQERDARLSNGSVPASDMKEHKALGEAQQSWTRDFIKGL